MAPENGRYNLMELMVCVAARQLEDGKTAVIGTGMPLAAAMLAQKTKSPNLITMFEAGSVAPILCKLPISVADSWTQTNALMHSSMNEIMEACQRGVVDYTFLGGAQIDMYGNINSTMIGKDYYHPKVRLPGSGGANDLASSCWKTLVITPHDKRRFSPTLDFLTTPGYLSGPGRARSSRPAERQRAVQSDLDAGVDGLRPGNEAHAGGEPPSWCDQGRYHQQYGIRDALLRPIAGDGRADGRGAPHSARGGGSAADDYRQVTA